MTPEDLNFADCIILIRPHNDLSLRIVRKFSKAGGFIIFFMDDDLFHLPSNEPQVPWRQKSLFRCLKCANVILSFSPLIVNRYSKFTKEKRGVAIDNVILEEELSSIPDYERHSIVKLVYAAGGRHEELFHTYIGPVLKALDQAYGASISLDFVGVAPKVDQSEYSFPIHFHPAMPLEEYREFMKTQRYDIGLAPLHDDPFSSCKYFNKYMEYTLVGTVGVYSKVKPYTYVVREGKNGLLAENNRDSWLEQISKLIDNEQLRKSCIESAKCQLKDEFNVDRIRERLLKAIPELESRRSKVCQVKSLTIARMIYRAYRVLDTIYLAVLYLKRGGFKFVWEKIQSNIQR